MNGTSRALLGIMVIVFVVFLAVYFSRGGNNQPAPVVIANKPADKTEPNPNPGPEPSPVRPKIEPKPDPKPIVDPPTPLPDPISTAPSPRLVDHSIPPPGRANSTDWIRLGAIETRVVGAMIGPVPLQDRSGHAFQSADPVLRVWIETRAVSPPKMELRRWGSSLDPARLSGPPGMVIPKSKVVMGADVQGELVGARKLTPGGAAIPDVLLFDLPPATAANLVLTLDGEHVGETGQTRHVIRPEWWKVPQ